MALQTHDSSGQSNHEYKRSLVLFIVANAVAVACYLCGAIFFYSLSLANKNISTRLRQGIVLVRTQPLSLPNLR
jgi:flagellar basal body-associated protein FliL